MQTRVLKECRALAPMWGLALLLVLVTALVPAPLGEGRFVLSFVIPVAGVLLSVSSFGKEYAHGTYGLLLSQPVSRWRLWWKKPSSWPRPSPASASSPGWRS